MAQKSNQPEDAAALVREGKSNLLFQGNDELGIETALTILEDFVPEAARLFNVERYDGGEMDASRLGDALANVPMMTSSATTLRSQR